MGASFANLDRRRQRHLLVALNAAESIPRDTALRLARDPGGWLAERDPAAAHRAAGGRGVAAGRRAAAEAPAVYRRESRLAGAVEAEILTRADSAYPPSLLDLELPPAVLYHRGRLPTAPAVAIVGSRDADVYGLQVAERLAAELAAAGLVIVSGFAVGVDAAAHRGALAAGGPTVAVLGCGIDVLYPRPHRRLRERVVRRGALVSEFRMGTPPEARHFPVRNRIIAALSFGTLVVRAAPRSGSLITARLALDLGREVWAVPGNISDRRSVGTNSLIRDGAQPVLEARDVLDSLPLSVRDRLTPVAAAGEGAPPGDRPPTPPEDPAARRLLRHLPRGELVGRDRLIASTGLPAEQVIATLLNLELDGRLKRYPGPVYCRR